MGDGGAGLARINTADQLRTRLQHPRGVLGGLGPGDALDDDLRILVQENRHILCPLKVRSAAQAAAAAHAGPAPNRAAVAAASSIVATSVTNGWLASARIRRPSTTLLPSSRTTSC